MHHTKDKGDLGVAIATVDLIERGFIVSKPCTEHAPFDLVITKGSITKTLQVKSSSIKNGVISASFRSSWSDKHGFHQKLIDKSLVDLFCLVCLNSKKCYYFDHNKIANKTAFSIRLEKPKNNQNTNVQLAENYLIVPFF